MGIRLLFDENLAARLVQALSDAYPGSQHVETALGRGATDEAIWKHAIDADLVIVTKDEDFERLSVWRGAPPKVIWLRTGNCTTAAIMDLLRRNRSLVADFIGHEDATFLALG